MGRWIRRTNPFPTSASPWIYRFAFFPFDTALDALLQAGERISEVVHVGVESAQIVVTITDGQPRGFDSFPCQRSAQAPNGLVLATSRLHLCDGEGVSSVKRSFVSRRCDILFINVLPAFSLAGFPATKHLFRNLLQLGRWGVRPTKDPSVRIPFFSYRGTNNHRTVRCPVRLLIPSRGSVFRDPLSTGPTHPPLT